MSADLTERIAQALRLRHFDGHGCGDPLSPGACSCCYGPSPMTEYEVAGVALAAVTNAPGLEEALHHALDEPVGFRWSDDPTGYRTAQGKRLADVVRAWLRAEGRDV